MDKLLLDIQKCGIPISINGINQQVKKVRIKFLNHYDYFYINAEMGKV